MKQLGIALILLVLVGCTRGFEKDMEWFCEQVESIEQDPAIQEKFQALWDRIAKKKNKLSRKGEKFFILLVGRQRDVDYETIKQIIQGESGSKWECPALERMLNDVE